MFKKFSKGFNLAYSIFGCFTLQLQSISCYFWNWPLASLPPLLCFCLLSLIGESFSLLLRYYMILFNEIQDGALQRVCTAWTLAVILHGFLFPKHFLMCLHLFWLSDICLCVSLKGLLFSTIIPVKIVLNSYLLSIHTQIWYLINACLIIYFQYASSGS